MIEHFLMWLDLMPLLNHTSEIIIYAFFNRVFKWWNTLCEIFTNQSKKLYGEFQNLCEKSLIDHHTTSQNHLNKVDGLAKWMVQVVK
jgi:hemoglobin-like flavoprotein